MSKILIVDDEQDLAEGLRRSLARDQHLVEVAYDGREAIDMLAVSKYDLIVLDWMMPKQSGIDVCKWLRDKQDRTPILMLTAKGELEDKEKGLDSGADDYLTKPFHLREFQARVRALLRRGSSVATSHVLTYGKITLDAQARKVTRDGAEIKLEPKEFNLLEFLMRNPNQAFTADALVTRVWESDTEVSSDAVRVYIRYLRKKLDVPGTDSIIETVHGSGYRLVGGS
jgi:OmpR-family two-component system manganese-sensing response regulator